MEQPRLIQIDGTHCEATLEGNLTFVMSEDVPGVIGYIGDVFGKNGVNIATFSLGRKEAGTEAISVIQTDQPMGDKVVAELLKNSAVKVAWPVKLNGLMSGAALIDEIGRGAGIA